MAARQSENEGAPFCLLEVAAKTSAAKSRFAPDPVCKYAGAADCVLTANGLSALAAASSAALAAARSAASRYALVAALADALADALAAALAAKRDAIPIVTSLLC